MPLEELPAVTAILLILSIFASQTSGRLGVPALPLFLALGMLAGSEGIGGIWFDNVAAAEWLGVIALAFLLFAGGPGNDWRYVRGSAWQAVSLSTIGVAVTSALVGLAAVLIVVARPVAVFIALAAARMPVREKLFVSWVGLRGAVPIILATFPLLAAAPKAPAMFNIVFFVVIASVLVQGSTIPTFARWLGVEAPTLTDYSPAAAHLAGRGDSTIVTVEVGAKSKAAGQRLVDLPEWPRDALVLVLYRGNEFFVPNGGTELHPDDRLIILTKRDNVDLVRTLMAEAIPAR